MSLNMCYFTGRTTRDVELRYSHGVDPIAVGNVNIAVNTGYGDSKKTEFPKMVIFGKRAEAMEKYVKKGTLITVWGEYATSKYKGRDGNEKTDHFFKVSGFEFGESKSAKSNYSNHTEETLNQPQQQRMDGFFPIDSSSDDEDLPF